VSVYAISLRIGAKVMAATIVAAAAGVVHLAVVPSLGPVPVLIACLPSRPAQSLGRLTLCFVQPCMGLFM